MPLRHYIMFMVLVVNLAACQSSGITTNKRNSPETSGLIVQSIEGIDDSFIKGVDLSSIIEAESKGAKFYDQHGQAQDIFKILADHNVNWVRIRLWNKPYDVYWSTELTKHQTPIQGAIGGGTNDLATAIEIAKRAKKHNMQVSLDFHYSDFWADPKNQRIPGEWLNLDQAELEDALYQFTYNSLTNMQQQQVFPDMVQIGNEIDNGFVWPKGKTITSPAAIALIKAGITAAKDASQLAKRPLPIMLHLGEGGNTEKLLNTFDSFAAAKLDYDIIGLSFYPYWHGDINTLQYNLSTLSQRYKKPVVVAETAYAYTLDNLDNTNNIFGKQQQNDGGFTASVQGQASALREIFNAVATVPAQQGLGVFYWEPAWLRGGWVTGQGNAWENQALFDLNGKVLASMNVFSLIHQDALSEAPILVSTATPTYQFSKNQSITLPDTIAATYSDDSVREVPVQWSLKNLPNSQQAGTYSISGLSNTQHPVNAWIVVSNQENHITNPGFEDGHLAPWHSSSKVFKVSNEQALSGQYALNYWAGKSQKVALTQEITGLPVGRYQLSANMMGKPLKQGSISLLASTTTKYYPLRFSPSGWNNWQHYSTEIVSVTDGKLSLSIKADLPADSWGWIDDLQLVLLDENSIQ
ncbi:glycosyl hydrolase 53 family protein [Agarivorans sp. TSD2052]|uniref:glycosyl hydrolase 53 family protein n=1 Tax=Agarivorans sp. TSD2052 TaxID=2937286 RepID=UPI00200E56C1|nr:glycosyl hydrolase 53 family protein [Agarivorans sp. TSD2052]UPW19691.1 glycosyl hydrolase 53 family protein [Agarivorans sp. TSD2052]